MDIIIFGGQSNMQGLTESRPENLETTGCFEYKYLTDELVPLAHPVGETIGDYLLCAAHEGRGSLVPAFCREYIRQTGRDVVAVSAARSSTAVIEWHPDIERFAITRDKILAAIKKVGQADKIYYVWLQGESDAIRGTSENEYVKLLTIFKNAMKKSVNFERFCIIKVGYFADSASLDYSDEEKIRRDETIMAAQERLVKEDDDFVMLTRICPELSRDPAYNNPSARRHFNNAAMEIIGKEAGAALAKLVK